MRRLVNIITEAMAFVSVIAVIMAFNWAFWVTGDEGPDEVFTVLAVGGLTLGLAAILIDYLYKAYRRNHARKRRRSNGSRRKAESRRVS